MDKTVHCVYWIENDLPHAEFFTSLTDMLNFSLSKHNDKQCSFIATGSKIENCVSLSGVDAPCADYNWKKRRR